MAARSAGGVAFCLRLTALERLSKCGSRQNVDFFGDSVAEGGEEGVKNTCFCIVARYTDEVIVDFHCKQTRELWMTGHNRRFASIAKQALSKLQMMNRAENLDDLRVPPGNRLEALRGNRAGQHSIRINQQWRICFRWTHEGPEAVEIADYH